VLHERFASEAGEIPMQTECSADLFGFTPVDGRKVVAEFDGGQMTSEAGAMLLGATDKHIRLIERFADCFTDYRDVALVEHTVRVWSVSGCSGSRWATRT
jgi:Fe-S oxidoreductase